MTKESTTEMLVERSKGECLGWWEERREDAEGEGLPELVNQYY